MSGLDGGSHSTIVSDDPAETVTEYVPLIVAVIVPDPALTIFKWKPPHAFEGTSWTGEGEMPIVAEGTGEAVMATVVGGTGDTLGDGAPPPIEHAPSANAKNRIQGARFTR